MFKPKKKEKDEKKKDNNVEDLPETFKPETEKLVESKMEEIETSLKKFKPKEEIDTSSIPSDLSTLEEELQQEEQSKKTSAKVDHISSKQSPAVAKFKPELKSILPPWVEKPFYYVTPQENLVERRKIWQKEWAEFLVQWANAKDKYQVEILALMQEYPFKNPVINKQLSKDQLQLIGDFLAIERKGEWKDKTKNHLRVYWESIESTAEAIFQWAFERGLRYLGVFDVLDAKQPFSELSSDEIYQILVILVKVNKAEWADKKKEMAYLLFPV